VYIATFSMGAQRLPSQHNEAGMRAVVSDGAASTPEAASVGGWFGSSLDLLRGLEMRELGPHEWLNEGEIALAAA
jgi:hypothetical protein